MRALQKPAEYRFRMAGRLEGDAKVAGLGNHHTRGQAEARADKAELKSVAKAHKDKLVDDTIEITRDNAVAAVGGHYIGKAMTGNAGTRAISNSVAKETEAAAVSSKNTWLSELDSGVGGKSGTMSTEAQSSWSKFKEVVKRKAGEKFEQVTDDLYEVHKTGNGVTDKVTYRKKVSLVEFKTKLKNNGFTDAEANYWTKELADKEILGEFNAVSKSLPDEELWKMHAKKTYDGKAAVPSDKYAPLVKAGQRDEAFEKAYQELQDLKQATNQMKANAKTPMQSQVNASSDARALEKYLNDHFPDKMAAATPKVEAQVVAKPDFDELYGKFQNATGQDRINIQLWLEKNHYKEFKEAVRKKP